MIAVANNVQSTVLTLTRVSGMDLETRPRRIAGIVLCPGLEGLEWRVAESRGAPPPPKAQRYILDTRTRSRTA